IVGMFQTRTLILNAAQRAAALVTDVRVVSRVDGPIESEQHPAGSSWSLQDGDTVVATFADEHGTPLVVITNAAQSRIGILSAAQDRLRTRWIGTTKIGSPQGQGAAGLLLTPTVRFSVGDLDMDFNPELVGLAPDAAGGAQLGVLHLIPRPMSSGLAA